MSVALSAGERTEGRKAKVADLRRKAFRSFMLKNNLSPAEWARLSGLPTANAIYNFLNGRSSGLSQDTLQRLADALPNTLVSDLMGETAAKRIEYESDERIKSVKVRSICKAGLWRRLYDIPSADQEDITIIQEPNAPIDEAVLVSDDSCDRLYPKGSYALIRKMRSGEIVDDGDTVVVMRSRRRRNIEEHEVTIRQVDTDHGNRLVWRSSNMSLYGEVKMPPRYWEPFTVTENTGDRTEQVRYEIVGIVQLAQTPNRVKRLNS